MSNRLGNRSEHGDHRRNMKRTVITTIAAVLLVGCATRIQPPDISIHQAANKGNIEAVKQHLAAGTDVNEANVNGHTEIAEGAEVDPNIQTGPKRVV